MKWIYDNNLILNVDKATELIVDIKISRNFKDPILISGSTAKQVTIYKFLGLTVMNSLSWNQNADKINLKREDNGCSFLRILKSYNVDINVMINFYCAVVESIFITNILIWFMCTNKREIKKIESIIRTADGIIGTSLRTTNLSGSYHVKNFQYHKRFVPSSHYVFF